MTNPDYTHLLLVVDRSGSMENIADDMNGGIATLLWEQAVAPGKIRVDAWTFDATIEHVAKGALPGATSLTRLVRPRGATALYDAIGMAVTDLGRRFSERSEDKRPGKVVVAIVTDGMENASRAWTQPSVKALLQQQQDEYAWQVLFLGANIDAISVGDDLGVPMANSMNFTASSAGVNNSWSATSRLLRSYRGAGAGQSIGGYDEADRDEAAL